MISTEATDFAPICHHAFAERNNSMHKAAEGCSGELNFLLSLSDSSGSGYYYMSERPI
jgi:hypothetical protein